jgi:hypothetical protein
MAIRYIYGKFYSHLVHFVVIWYIFLVLVFCTKKNLASLLMSAATAKELVLGIKVNFPGTQNSGKQITG